VLNPRTSALVYRAATGPGEAAILSRAIPSDLGFAGVAFSERRTVRVDDASADERHAARIAKSTAFEPGPMLVVPLLVPRTKGDGDEERVLGVLSALRARGDASFTTSDERLLTLIAHRVAFAIDEEERKERARTREQLESMGRMLAGIVHDFKTPMTVISGYVQLMAAEEDPAERQACANQVLKSTEQMSSMIKQLLSFARGDSSALLRKMWVETLVRDAADTLQRVVGSSGVELVVDVRSKAALRADDLKIKRALVNLVKNAREALTQTPPAAPQQARITVTVADEGEHICLSVADNGPGLSPQIETRLFQEFATWGKTDGTGLGLALVKRIAEEHGGGVLVDNRPGEGCTFTLRLPKA
jgi:signal transduction histidine kinase